MRDAIDVANNADDLVQSASDLLIAISKSAPAHEQNFVELKRWFNEISKKYPYYKNIIFVDMDGNIRAAAHNYTKPDGEIIANVKQTAYYKRSLKATGLAYGDFMLSVLSNKPVIHITYPVYDNAGKRLGFVAMAFDLSRLQHRIVTANISKGSEVSVFDQNGTVIARTLEPSNWIGKCFKSSDMFKVAKSGMKNVTGPGPDGVVRLTSFHATKRAPWMVAVCYDKEAIRNQALGDLYRQLALFVPLLLVAIMGWLWIGGDVDGLYKAARRLSLTDPTTSLGSFQKFNQDLVKDIARAKRHLQSLSLMLVDIDGFKQFNEENGFLHGNRALEKIADIIRDELRDTDFAYRYGGDEVCLLLSDTDELDAQEFAERVQRKVAQGGFVNKEKRLVGLSVSIGIATYPLDASDAEGLVQCATEALFDAKGQGETVAYSQTPRPSRVKKGN